MTYGTVRCQLPPFEAASYLSPELGEVAREIIGSTPFAERLAQQESLTVSGLEIVHVQPDTGVVIVKYPKFQTLLSTC